jgi:non-heme chloroperoxidase
MSMYYVEKGQGDAVVFVHGVIEDYRAWDAQVGPFSESFRAISYSRRASEPNQNGGAVADSTIANNVGDLVGLVEELEASPVTVVGHSYGAHIAAYFAMQNPGLVAKLVLAEPGIPTISLKDGKSVTGLISMVLKHPEAALSVDGFLIDSVVPALVEYHTGSPDRAVATFLDGIQGKKGALGTLPGSAQAMMLENADTLGELEANNPILSPDDPGSITAPTLLVKGTTDPSFMRDAVDLMAKIIPGSREVAVPNSGHFVQIENPDFFNREVLGFLGG